MYLIFHDWVYLYDFKHSQQINLIVGVRKTHANFTQGFAINSDFPGNIGLGLFHPVQVVIITNHVHKNGLG